VLAVINASPFHMGKSASARPHGRRAPVGLPLVYAHLVGGQDEVVFDGASFALHAGRAGRARASRALLPWLAQRRVAWQARSSRCRRCPRPRGAVGGAGAGRARLHRQERLPGRLLGLSGGIDSALVLAIAVDALGADKVRAVMMPSPYTADISWIDARDMAERLGVRYDEIAIAPEFEAFKARWRRVCRPARGHDRGEHPGAHPRHAADGAVQQVRLDRADHRQQERDGHRLLHAYGDMAGGFAVIKDVAKTLVFALARWRARPLWHGR
jgi:NAD+ synthase (glutamine-hydrolysing)